MGKALSSNLLTVKKRNKKQFLTMEKFAAIFVVLLFTQALLASGVSLEEKASPIASPSISKGRFKRNFWRQVSASSLSSLLLPMVDSFCNARCVSIQETLSDEFLKAVLPCSSVCKLINVGAETVSRL